MAAKLELNLQAVRAGAGCASCHGLGFDGRVGIFEALPVTPTLQAHIVKQPRFEQLRQQAIADGMVTLLQDAAAKVKDGVIGLDELVRIAV